MAGIESLEEMDIRAIAGDDIIERLQDKKRQKLQERPTSALEPIAIHIKHNGVDLIVTAHYCWADIFESLDDLEVSHYTIHRNYGDSAQN